MKMMDVKRASQDRGSALVTMSFAGCQDWGPIAGKGANHAVMEKRSQRVPAFVTAPSISRSSSTTGGNAQQRRPSATRRPSMSNNDTSAIGAKT